MQASAAALKAAEIISQQGLSKGVLQDSEGRVCHNGAIFIAVNGDVLSTENMPLAREVIHRSQIILDRREEHLVPHTLNDAEHTTAEDIILLLKENAALDDDPEAMALIEECRSRGDFTPKTVILDLPVVTPFPLLFTVNSGNQILPSC